MSDWSALTAELDLWRNAGQTATFWWRDDDAAAWSPALARLLTLAGTAGVPLAIAAIPARAERSLADALSGQHQVTPVQHGYAHADHAPGPPPGGKPHRKWELGAHRPLDVITAELARGWSDLSALFGESLAPIMVPPWNRIDPTVIAALPALGFRGLSTFGPRTRMPAAPRLTQTNTHIDIINWHGRRDFIGEAAAIGAATHHLRARRDGRVDPREPTGLLTHHLAHDDACWDFIGAFLDHIAAHQGARWIDTANAFGLAEADMPS